IQIAFAGAGTGQGHGHIRFLHMPGPAVDSAVYRHRGDTHGAGGADDAAGNLAAVGYQQTLDHDSGSTDQVGGLFSINARSSSCTSALLSRMAWGLLPIRAVTQRSSSASRASAGAVSVSSPRALACSPLIRSALIASRRVARSPMALTT